MDEHRGWPKLREIQVGREGNRTQGQLQTSPQRPPGEKYELSELILPGLVLNQAGSPTKGHVLIEQFPPPGELS